MRARVISAHKEITYTILAASWDKMVEVFDFGGDQRAFDWRVYEFGTNAGKVIVCVRRTCVMNRGRRWRPRVMA